MPSQLSGYPLPNADYAHCVRIPVPVLPGVVQLPDIEILDDFVLEVKAWPGNPAGANYVYIAENPSSAVNPDLAWPLVQNESKTFRIKNAKELYASATAGPSWLVFCIEIRRRNG